MTTESRPVVAGTSLMPQSLSTETLPDFLLRLREASRSRATFDVPAGGRDARRVCRLSRGEASEKLICLPAPLALCGPQQFVKFARHFRSVRDVSVLTIPGFVGKERLPATPDVAIQDQAAAIQHTSGRSPSVLVGYSSGGVFAYGLAGYLERIGMPVAAVVLLDSYPPGGSGATDQVEGLMLTLLNSPEWRPYLNDTRLTAMAWYTEWMMSWELRAVDAPTLLVTASKPMSDHVSGDGWQPIWPFRHDTIEVAGDHFTMLQDHADVAAESVEDWLDSVLA
jgi:thioesterase domain-containing protein